jgi:hypothetical protein
VLLKTTPEQGALNFKKKRVALTFNEYVQLKDIGKQFLMSPPPEKRPTVNIRGKQVQVDFNSPLRDSTTYSLDFGQAIADNNEGNPYSRYRFAFSTGAWLDTLSVEGLALDAFTDRPVADALVYLYENLEDSVVLKQRPDNISRPAKNGVFMAENLKAKPYKMLALADANKNYRYDVGQEAIGFLDVAVEPLPLPEGYDDADTMSYCCKERDSIRLVLRMFTEALAAQLLTSCERPQRRQLRLTFNAPFPTVDSLTIDSVDVSTLVVEPSAKRDTLLYWFADTAAHVPDTLNIRFVYLKTDTLGQLSPFAEKRRLIFTPKPTSEPAAKEKKTSSGLGGLLNRIVGNDEEVQDTTPKKPANWTLRPAFGTTGASPIAPATLTFEALPIALNPALIKIEERQVHVRTKDTTYVDVKFTLRQDSIRLRSYSVVADWKVQTTYRYMMLPTAFWDVYAQTNDTMRGTFITLDPEKLASLTVSFTQAQGSYVVQLTDDKGSKVLRRQRLSEDTKVTFLYLTPGSYCIRVIKDDNANGEWDTGCYFKRLQPEYATFLKSAPDKITHELRQGWEVELSVDLKNLFPDGNSKQQPPPEL